LSEDFREDVDFGDVFQQLKDKTIANLQEN
jgi:hypothetical protein